MQDIEGAARLQDTKGAHGCWYTRAPLVAVAGRSERPELQSEWLQDTESSPG
jgi:hypothetical protein